MTTLYEKLGGEAAIDAAVDKFYVKVLADDSLKEFFNETSMDKQRRMQKNFLTVAFGGPNNYEGRNMREAHEKAVKQGLSESHFNSVVGHLAATLTELGVADDDIAEVAKVADSIKADVLNL